MLFNLTADPYELRNIYNETRASVGGAQLIDELERKLRAFVTCAGAECRAAGGEAV